jgi:hypothetical protein
MVIAVGLGIAVVNTLPSVQDRLEIAWDHVPLLAALLVTLVPFYHGALLHLDAMYERPSGRRHPTFLLLLDFVGLFVEAVVIVALAVSVGDVHSFAIGLTVLLAVDVVWATLAWRLGGETEKLRSWIQINLTTLAGLGLGILSSIWVDYADQSWTVAIVLVTFLRSSVDYWLNWDFYGGQAATAA